MHFCNLRVQALNVKVVTLTLTIGKLLEGLEKSGPSPLERASALEMRRTLVCC